VSLEPPSDAATIAAAARLLERGDLVAFPTETVYGLGADAENPAAVEKIYLAKGRPSNHPLIVHLSPEADVGYWSDAVGDAACRLMAAFWPGPLTLILSRAPHIPDTVAGGQQSIGLRCPSHPVAQALLREFKAGRGGIAAPSANRFGHVSPTLAQHVRDEFRDAPLLSCVLEGGQSEVGIESTILDLSRGAPVLLRPGHVDSLQIAKVLGVMPGLPDAAAPRASGTLASHYAPRTPLVVVSSAELGSVLARLAAAGHRVALMHHGAIDASIGRAGTVADTARATLPAEPVGYAHDLYAALRRLDLCRADLILVEALPDTAPWQAVGDRLRRAAHGSTDALARLLV
jgi:L-threonylcarbamoyladenylate synthase